MIIKTPKTSDEIESRVTDENIYRNRRELLKQMGYLGTAGMMASNAQAQLFGGLFGGNKDKEPSQSFKTTPLDYATNDQFGQGETPTPERQVTSYNNFYEFGTGKDDPVKNSQGFQVNPWQLVIDGEVEKPITLDYDDIINSVHLEERIYRMRCVEAWSMVIPWVGIPLSTLLKKVVPTSKAKYVAFKTLHDPKQMPGQASRFMGGGLPYPYTEGLRMDEAMNDLTLLAVGVYGKTLPPQNGAPIRLVTPWKYGFKGIKSIVKISLTEKQPPSTWNVIGPSEYGFYANVNPEVDHPRWSQASERRITGAGLFAESRIETQMFNGYQEQVAHLYSGMDLRKFY